MMLQIPNAIVRIIIIRWQLAMIKVYCIGRRCCSLFFRIIRIAARAIMPAILTIESLMAQKVAFSI
jgi:hypothetical protein